MSASLPFRTKFRLKVYVHPSGNTDERKTTHTFFCYVCSPIDGTDERIDSLESLSQIVRESLIDIMGSKKTENEVTGVVDAFRENYPSTSVKLKVKKITAVKTF
jgi:hypothetical protein